jgi:hypothetical protein
LKRNDSFENLPDGSFCLNISKFINYIKFNIYIKNT